MPNYDYLCSKCGKTVEVFQSMKDKPLTKCPDAACRGKVKRLLGTGAGLIFKGSGFYITDYRSEGYKSAAKSDTAAASSAASATASPASPASDSGGSAKPEPKPAPKAGGDSKPATKATKSSG